MRTVGNTDPPVLFSPLTKQACDVVFSVTIEVTNVYFLQGGSLPVRPFGEIVGTGTIGNSDLPFTGVGQSGNIFVAIAVKIALEILQICWSAERVINASSTSQQEAIFQDFCTFPGSRGGESHPPSASLRPMTCSRKNRTSKLTKQ